MTPEMIWLTIGGMLIGYALNGFFNYFEKKRMMDDFNHDCDIFLRDLENLADEVNKLIAEVEQHGFEVYKRKGIIEIRKASPKRGRPKKTNK